MEKEIDEDEKKCVKNVMEMNEIKMKYYEIDKKVVGNLKNIWKGKEVQ